MYENTELWDSAEAMRLLNLYQVPADQQGYTAQFNLVVSYFKGLGTGVRITEAVRVWRLAVDQVYAQALKYFFLGFR